MRIVHIGKHYFPDAGGIESVTLTVARGAAAAGHQVTVVCFGAPVAGPETYDGVEVVRVAPLVKLASQPLSLGYLWQCIRLGRKADLVHLHAPNMLGALAALLLGPRARLVIHWHSDVLDKGWLSGLMAPLERMLLRRADAIIATSPAYAQASPLLSEFKGKVVVVPIGIAEPAAGGELPPELATILGKQVVLAVGRLVAYKGFDTLVAAAERLCEGAVVVIVGGGPLHDELQAAIKAGGAEGRVLMAGRVSDETLGALFKAASLFCLPSRSRAEAFGVVLVEAMARGVPVVASDIAGSGVPWVNQHGVTGFNVPVGDAGALADACNRILSSGAERMRLSAGARARYLAEFTEPAFVAQVNALYQRLVRG